jgi:hypothetical protein
MSEIERNSPNLGMDDNELDDEALVGDEDMIEKELRNLRNDSGNTSVDSLMEDTPSNYN